MMFVLFMMLCVLIKGIFLADLKSLNDCKSGVFCVNLDPMCNDVWFVNPCLFFSVNNGWNKKKLQKEQKAWYSDV